jgi:hypothetical protein
MNIQYNIEAAIDTILEKADEIAVKQSNKLITSKVESWHDRFNEMKLNQDVGEANRSMASLFNETSPIVDQWERGVFLEIR